MVGKGVKMPSASSRTVGKGKAGKEEGPAFTECLRHAL